MKPEWILPDQKFPEIESISKKTGIDKNLVSILVSRGIIEENEIRQFLYPELNSLHSPFLLNGIYDAIARLKTALDKGEKIAIFGDSDLDGITSLTIVYNILLKSGSAPVIRYPRAKESYGLTRDIVDEFIGEKVTLVITVDSGIRDCEEIEYGKTNGIDFIVTDHHEPDTILPDAVIINPKTEGCSYPYKDLAGVGVAFKFVQAFLYSYTSGFNTNFVLIHKAESLFNLRFVKNGICTKEFNTGKDDIVAVLTTEISPADYIVLLNTESLSLASIIRSMHRGINITDIRKIASSFSKTDYKDNTVMIDKLCTEFRINKNNSLTETDMYSKLFIELQWRSSKKILTLLQEYAVLFTIGTIADIMPLTGENRQLVKFGLSMINRGEGHSGILSLTEKSRTTAKSIAWDIAPLLNAPGRMGETGLTVDFFLEQDDVKTAELVKSIQKINRDRKKLVQEIIDKIKDDNSDTTLNDSIFFYMHDDIIDGLAGLIANRIADDLKKPAIIATGSDKKGIVKGSARSSGNFDFFKFTEPVAHLFERVGGHAQAFGFTAELKNIKEIVETINRSITDKFIPDKSIRIDSVIELNDINAQFIKSLSLLEPFGKCNEEPVFAVKGASIEGFSSFGSQGNHGKFVFSKNIQAIGWNMIDKMSSCFNAKKDVDILFKLENNEYMGRVYPRMIIIDMDSAE